jgi:DNA-binding MarR family transcriptional regulator
VDAAQTPGLSLLLSQLSKRIFRYTDEAAMGLRIRHYVALSFLRSYGSVSQQALAELLHLDANNLVILLNELEADGLVVRRRDAHDRRRHIVEITPAGRKVVLRAERAQAANEDVVLAGLSVDERRRLQELLIRAVAAVEETATTAEASAAPPVRA